MFKVFRIGRQQRCRQAAGTTHAELFLERYDQLLAWTQRLTRDRRQAEDLLHDVFIQFTLSCPDLDQIASLDGYLRRALRNLFVTHTRRADCLRMESLSMLDFDSADTGLSTLDGTAQLQARDELRVICQYACARKETSKAGSVLILRYFHGYYPSEIAQVTRATRNAVFCRLRLAREEAEQCLENPDQLTALTMAPSSVPVVDRVKRSDLTAEFRRAIFATRHGNCLSEQEIRDLYRSADPESVTCETLAHFVSCPDCLESVNRILHLPPLSQRFPGDTIGPEDPSGPPDGPTGTGSGGSEQIARMLRRRKETFEHHPRELFVMANGYRVGSQKTGSEVIDYKLTVNLVEPLSLVEVLSNTGVRLLMLNVEPLVEGGSEQSAKVSLSDQRTLEVKLDQNGHWPSVHVIYHDPLEAPVAVRATDQSSPEPSLQIADLNLPCETQSRHLGIGPISTLWDELTSGWKRWLTPAAATIALLAVVGALAHFWPSPHKAPYPAASLLRDAAVSEQKALAKPGWVTHRTLIMEEREPATGKLIAQHRIESWQAHSAKLLATRVYSRDGRLVGGEWIKRDGTRVILQNAKLTTTSADASQRQVAIWQLLPSPRNLESAQDIQAENQPTVYVLHYKNAQGGGPKVLNASLTVRRSDLHAVEQFLRLEEDGQVKDYRFIETGFEQTPFAGIPARLFDVDASLGTPTASIAAKPLMQPMAVSADMIVDVLDRIDRIHALTTGELELRFSSPRKLLVTGVADDEARKSELLRALGGAAANPAISVQIMTADEAAQIGHSQPARLLVRSVDQPRTPEPPPALREYVARKTRLSGEALSTEVTRYSNAMLANSTEAQLQVTAIKRMFGALTDGELSSMSPAVRERWAGLVSQHAEKAQQEFAALRRALGPLSGTGGQTSLPVAQVDDLRSCSESLTALTLKVYQLLGQSLTEPCSNNAIVSRELWQALTEAEALASAMTVAARRP